LRDKEVKQVRAKSNPENKKVGTRREKKERGKDENEANKE
jgi:hypothetical protein